MLHKVYLVRVDFVWSGLDGVVTRWIAIDRKY